MGRQEQSVRWRAGERGQARAGRFRTGEFVVEGLDEVGILEAGVAVQAVQHSDQLGNVYGTACNAGGASGTQGGRARGWTERRACVEGGDWDKPNGISDYLEDLAHT